MEPHFREVQRFRQAWLVVILLLSTLPLAYGTYQQLILGQPWGNKPVSDTALILIDLAFLLFLIWFLSLKLVTEVRDHELYVHFVRLWRARRIPLEKIRRASAVTYSPIMDYGGGGVRCGKKGWAYNVSGNRGVELELDDGKIVLVGSQLAEELSYAIEQNRRTMMRAG